MFTINQKGGILANLMHLLIDTWNVLHQTGILPPENAGIGIKGLTRLVATSRLQGCLMTLVCDGTNVKEGVSSPRVTCEITGPHNSADDEIIERIRASSGARDTLVITSDQTIIKAVKAAGAQCMKSEHFLKLLIEDSRLPESKRTHRPSGLSQKHADAWKTIFDVDCSLVDEMEDVQLPNHLKREADDAPIESTKQPKKKKSSTQKGHQDDLMPKSLIEEARKLIDP